MKRVCVFCGSNNGANPVYPKIAEDVGLFLVGKQIDLVYGGGRTGLMGKIADTVMHNGGSVIGIIPKSLAEKEVAHASLTKLHVVGSMHERKALMAELADGFIALPGGFGTFEELCEIITWAQLGLHSKPFGILNTCGYYDPLIELFDRAEQEQFLRPEHRALVFVEREIGKMFDLMKNYKPH